jgi:transcriptional regulator with XRE-family HTH domain
VISPPGVHNRRRKVTAGHALIGNGKHLLPSGAVPHPWFVSRFGIELRRARLAAGLSLSRFATLVHYSKGYLSKIETGAMPPTTDLARRCDAALNAGGALAALCAETADPETETEPEPDPDGEEEAWLMVLAAPRRQPDLGGAELIAVYRDMFTRTRALARMTSPDLVLSHVIAQTHALRSLAGGANRRELLVLAARYADYAGSLAQETGDLRATLWWTAVAARMATAAGDHHMPAYALARRAHIAVWQRDARTAVGYAEQAQADTRVLPLIRGLAAQQQAQGHAIAGEASRCRRALDRAEELLAEETWPSDLTFGSTAVPDAMGFNHAWTSLQLGRPAEAAAILDREVLRVPPAAVRNLVRYGVKRALAHAAAGEVEQACAVAEPLLPKFRQVRSTTIKDSARQLAATLRRWPRHPAVTAIAPELTAALHPG